MSRGGFTSNGIILISGGGGGGGFALIQQSPAAITGTAINDISPTLPTAASAGSTVFLFVTSSSFGKNLSGVSGLGGTWSQLCFADNTDDAHDIAEIWWATNITGGGTSATATFSSQADNVSSCLAEFSFAGTAIVDAAGTAATGTSAAPATSSVATTNNGMVVALLEAKGTVTASSGPTGGFTAASSSSNNGAAFYPSWLLSGLGGSKSTSWGLSASAIWAAVIASVK